MINYQLLNQLIRVYERIKGDLATRLSLIFISSGIALLINSSLALSASYKDVKGTEVSFLANVNGTDWLNPAIGFVLVCVGIYFGLQRFRALSRDAAIKDVGLFFMPGFENLNERLPHYAIPRLEQSKIMDVKFPKFDSYNPLKIQDEYMFRVKTIEDRVHHSAIKKGYVSALGSVPYLYLTGTMFKDGHIPLRVLEHSRTENKWHVLDDVGRPCSLYWDYGQDSGDRALENVTSNSEEELALSVSFTNMVAREELPEAIKGHCLNVKLSSGYSYDALLVESVQDEVIKKIAHAITTLAKKCSTLHLFICAQASVVVKLGELYQNGMTGVVVVHNYNSTTNSYDWAMSYDGVRVSKLQDS